VPDARTPLLEVRSVRKQFGAVTALADVSLTVGHGEVVAVLGDNGAGKSTLIKGLSGVHAFDGGEVRFEGEPVELRSPSEARALGIETVYQDLALFDNLSPAANFYIGREDTLGPRRARALGWMRQGAMNRKTREHLERLQVRIPSLTAPLGVMSGGQRQAVACARAVAFASRIAILDEPTAALGVREAAGVLELVKRLPGEGVSVILISHNLQQVVQVADRAVVLRQGRNVGEAEATPANQEHLVSLIVTGGRDGAAAAATTGASRSTSTEGEGS